MKSTAVRLSGLALLALSATVTFPLAAQPQANTVPFVASNLASPHISWSGNPVVLKGTLTSSAWGTDSFTYDWNPGDGGPHCTGAVTNQFVIACPYTYNGTVGSLYTAVLTITDTTTGQVSPASNCPPGYTTGSCYYTSLAAPPPNLAAEVDNAIDNGLWYLHTYMRHYTNNSGAPAGDWTGVGGNVDTNNAGGTGPNAVNCAAFENSGFLQTNTPSNPYSNDVALCLTGLFDQLTTIGVSTINDSYFGTYNPDSNGNNIGVIHNGYPENYQTGMYMDALVATGTPTTAIPAGSALASTLAGQGITGTGTGGAYTYKDAVYDMVDTYAYCQAPSYTGGGDEGFNDNGWYTNPTYTVAGGGWHYGCQTQTGDNSVSQWAAIGIIPAVRKFGAVVPPTTLTMDQYWLDQSFTQNSTNNGYFGYTSNQPIWGPYADTPSGLVQLAMNGYGRGTTLGGINLWDSAETYLRDNFGNDPSETAGSSLKAYYYGMFSFTKSMLLHNNTTSITGTPTPISSLQSLDDPNTCQAPGVPVSSPGTGTSPCYPAIDWYAAQTSAYGGTDATNGVARTLVSTQNSDGSWFGNNYSSNQYYLETGIAVTMLNKTVFQPVPVACFTDSPTQVASGGPVTLNGNCSVDQNPANSLVKWQWDVSGTGGTNFTIGPPYGSTCGNDVNGDPNACSAQHLTSACRTETCSNMVFNYTIPAGASFPYSYPVRLRVTDNTGLTADVVGAVVISSPPTLPTAVAGGPYNFCPNKSPGGSLVYAPFKLDGSQSSNPDQGKTDGTPGAPPSTIVSYAWDYSCSGAFTSSTAVQPDVTTAFSQSVDFGTSFNVCLQVTNNDNLAFPSAGLSAGLSATASAQVSIHNPTDEVCTHCVASLSSVSKNGSRSATPSGSGGNIQLNWTDTNTSSAFTIDHYNVYRSTTANFATYVQVAGAASSPFNAAVPVSSPGGGQRSFIDYNVIGGNTYYYRVAPATVTDTETCQGNVTLMVALGLGR